VFYFVLLWAGVIISGSPDSGHGGDRMLSYYREHNGAAQLAAFLIAVSAVIAVFFYGFLRSYLRRDPANEQLASVAFGGGIIFCSGVALFAGCLAALAASVHDPDPATMVALTAVGENVGFVIQGIGNGVALLASGIAILRGGLLPRWTGWSAIVLAVVAVPPTGQPLLPVGRFLAVGAWLLIVGVAAFARLRPVELHASGE
jgi:hypothetical protein